MLGSNHSGYLWAVVLDDARTILVHLYGQVARPRNDKVIDAQPPPRGFRILEWSKVARV